MKHLQFFLNCQKKIVSNGYGFIMFKTVYVVVCLSVCRMYIL